MAFKSIIGATCACLSIISFSASAAMISGQGTWETTLQGRDLDGNTSTFEAYYDVTKNITWLADAAVSGASYYLNFNVSGGSNLDLNISGVTGWRIPSSDSSCLGSNGYRDNCTNGEMGNLYYNVLGNTAGSLSNTGPFSNVQSDTYWASSRKSTDPLQKLIFNMGNGRLASEKFTYSGNRNYVWAVHDGDVGASVVPIPSAVWLFGSGLIGLIGFARRKA